MPAPLGSVVWAKPEIDGQAAGLLLLETIGVGAGERLDQRRLAVVDVTGGGDYAHRRRAAATASSLPGSIVRRSSNVAPSRVRAMIGGVARSQRGELIAGDADADRWDRRARRRPGARDRLRWLDLADACGRHDLAGALLQIVDRRGDHRPERDVGCRGPVEIGERRSLHRCQHVPARAQRPRQADAARTARRGRRGRR